MNTEPKPTNLKVLKALSHPTRLAIVRAVLGHDEITCQELLPTFDISQPTMSHHFNKLVKAGVLNNRRNGTVWIYSLNQAYIEKLGINLKQLTAHS